MRMILDSKFFENVTGIKDKRLRCVIFDLEGMPKEKLPDYVVEEIEQNGSNSKYVFTGYVDKKKEIVTYVVFDDTKGQLKSYKDYAKHIDVLEKKKNDLRNSKIRSQEYQLKQREEKLRKDLNSFTNKRQKIIEKVELFEGYLKNLDSKIEESRFGRFLYGHQIDRLLERVAKLRNELKDFNNALKES